MCVDDQKTNVLSRKSSCKNDEFQQHTTNSLWSKMLQLYLCIPWSNKDERTCSSTLNLGITWRWITSFMTQPLHPLGKDPSAYRVGERVLSWSCLNVLVNRLQSLCIENRSTIPRSSVSWPSHYYIRCSDQTSKLRWGLQWEQRYRIIK